MEEVNRKGGLYVREQGGYLPLELRYYDDQSKRQKAAHIVRELIISDRVDLLMGPYSSALTVEAAAVASSSSESCGTTEALPTPSIQQTLRG